MRRKRILFLLTIILLCATTMMAATKRYTLVLDAGHGGKDTGAPGAVSKEKTINLKVALAFGRLVEQNCSDVRVIYTRKTDVFVTLNERAEIANRNKADLFISIHTNAIEGKRQIRGMETYTLGNGRSNGKATNLDVAKRENSVIVMEKDYKSHYEGYDPNSPESNIMFEFVQDKNLANSVDLAKMIQRHGCRSASRPDKGVHQANLLVLRCTSMPACLVELGYISTRDEERLMNTQSFVNNIAKGLYNAFVEYKQKYDKTTKMRYKKYEEEAVAQVESKRPVIDPSQKPTEEKAMAMQKPAADTKSAVEKNIPEKKAAEKSVAVEKKTTAPTLASTKDTAVVKPATVSAPAPIAAETTASSTKPSTAAAVATPVASTASASPASKAEASKETSKETAKTETSEPETSYDGKPVFKIQILSSTKKISDGSSQLKGLKDTDYYEEGGLYKYTYGSDTDYNNILRMRKTVTGKFPDAFIIAFKNGEKMNVNEAIREFKKNR